MEVCHAVWAWSLWLDVEPGLPGEDQGTARHLPSPQAGPLAPGQVHLRTCVIPKVGSRDAANKCWVLDVRSTVSQGLLGAGAQPQGRWDVPLPNLESGARDLTQLHP